MRGGIEDNSRIVFLTSQRKHYIVALIRTIRDGSNDGSQYRF